MVKKKKDNERIDLDVRPGVFFKNYDYAALPDDPGPGPGLYTGKFKHKSVSEFRKEKEKRKKRQLDRLASLDYLEEMLKEAGVEL